MELNRQQVREFIQCSRFKKLAAVVLAAQAHAKAEQERVDAYIRPIFDSFEFYIDMTAARGRSRDRITDPKRLYLSTDATQTQRYYEACDAAHREHGFTGPEGHCPALIAHRHQLEAEFALVRLAGELLNFPVDGVVGELREKLISTLLGAAATSS